MICPLCKKAKSKVISTREISADLILRDRICSDYNCSYRFSTYEEIDPESGRIHKKKPKEEPKNE